MDEISLQDARAALGLIVDKARLADVPTRITRRDKPAAVIVSDDWYREVTELLSMAVQAVERGGFTIGDMEMLRERYREQAAAFRRGRSTAGLAPEDNCVVHHLDGNPYNNDPANLRVMDPKENDR